MCITRFSLSVRLGSGGGKSSKIEAKRIQLDLLKEDAKTLEQVLEEKLSKFVKEEETINNARKIEAIKQMSNNNIKKQNYKVLFYKDDFDVF